MILYETGPIQQEFQIRTAYGTENALSLFRTDTRIPGRLLIFPVEVHDFKKPVEPICPASFTLAERFSLTIRVQEALYSPDVRV